MRAPPSEKLFSAVMEVTVTNKSFDIALTILIFQKKGLYRDCPAKFAKNHFRDHLNKFLRRLWSHQFGKFMKKGQENTLSRS